MASLLRFLAAGLLALACALTGCGTVAGAKIIVSADPLSIALEITGQARPEWQSTTPPAATVPAGTVLNINIKPQGEESADQPLDTSGK